MDNILITGGAGFVGTNLADRLLRDGAQVTLFDNLARRGTQHNLDWLRATHGKRLRFVRGDVRDVAALKAAVAGCDTIFHLAAQVAVTTSVDDPRHDFEVNALGTFNVLEAARAQVRPPAVLFTSTNKVYGGLEDVALRETPRRWVFADRPHGIAETQPLDFHSPYGCSKGAADQYVRDYGRIYDIPTVVFRMSCIYGPHQFGNEDQGWVAHFLISAARNQPIMIYGDGKQVRDILFVDDLVAAFMAARRRIGTVAGQVFNIGGGAANTLAIWTEFAPLIRKLTGRVPPVERGATRPGDQAIYISDIRRAQEVLGWTPQVGVAQGCATLYHWIETQPHLFAPPATERSRMPVAAPYGDLFGVTSEAAATG